VTTNPSIVIPTFNRAKLVSKAIDTSLAQTIPCEVILCDHGSTDNTPEVAASYGDRIRYIRKEKDLGPIVCWRDGIEHASGDVVHINYDDDWIDPQFMERTLALLTDDVGFVYTRTRIHTPGEAETKVLQEHPAGVHPVSKVVQHLLRAKLTISPGCAIFRKKDLLKNLLTEIPGAKGVYGKNSGVGEDLLLFLLTSLDYPRYAHIAEPLAHFLAHPSSITSAAVLGGRKDVLVDAYAVAKQYYLQQSGSFPAAKGFAGWLSKRRWKLSGRGLF
jgi:glycosyltransferase involved in cell wall biosynthesis